MASKFPGAARGLATAPVVAAPLQCSSDVHAEDAEETLSFRSSDVTAASSPYREATSTCGFEASKVSSILTEASDSSTETGHSVCDTSDCDSFFGSFRSRCATHASEEADAGCAHALHSVIKKRGVATSISPKDMASYTIGLLLRIRAAMVVADEDSADVTLRYETRSVGSLPMAAAGGEKAIFVSSKAAPQSGRRSSELRTDGAVNSQRSVLAPSATSWAAAQQQRRRTASQGTLTSDEFARQVRSVLNKLTIERFDKLYDQLAGSGAQTPHHVAILVQEIFEKATGQHHFIRMYADLCGRLENDDRIIEAARINQTGQADSFRRILLNQCQASFEEMLTGSREWDTETYKADVVEEIRSRCKQRNLGNVKLIGYLLVDGLLSSKLLVTLCEELLDHRTTCQDALQCLASMLTILGATFDTDRKFPSKSVLFDIFERIKVLTKTSDVSPRMRFLLRDLLELREANWIDQKAATAQAKGPTRLDEVRVEDKVPTLSKTPPRWTPPTPASMAAKVKPNGASGARAPLQAPPAPVTHTASAKPPAVTAAPAAAVAALVVAEKTVPAAIETFSRTTFQRELWTALRDLAKDGDVRRAVDRIDRFRVPAAQQASEFTDLVTRAIEETVQETRRSHFALIARLAAKSSAFDQAACLEGIENFFLDIFDDLSEEMPGLAAIVTSEMVPALREVLPRAHVVAVVPPDLRC
eukprot:TRINITY_DN8922_c0_g1_i1.p1 TRINITY_DN8922_c0_g1~~TRINITY_DN8922_c0_g1_i1.p1  ORF type:complete len:732 (-),score=161.25 TRINITY_DN8922_c0_g1_i1:58-2166(-)